MRQCHVRTRNDAWTAHIRATLSIVKHLAIPSRHPSSRSSRFSGENGASRVKANAVLSSGAAFLGIWLLVQPRGRTSQTRERVQEKPVCQMRGRGMNESPRRLLRCEERSRADRSRGDATEQPFRSGSAFDPSVSAHAMMGVQSMLAFERGVPA